MYKTAVKHKDWNSWFESSSYVQWLKIVIKCDNWSCFHCLLALHFGCSGSVLRQIIVTTGWINDCNYCLLSWLERICSLAIGGTKSVLLPSSWCIRDWSQLQVGHKTHVGQSFMLAQRILCLVFAWWFCFHAFTQFWLGDRNEFGQQGSYRFPAFPETWVNSSPAGAVKAYLNRFPATAGISRIPASLVSGLLYLWSGFHLVAAVCWTGQILWAL